MKEGLVEEKVHKSDHSTIHRKVYLSFSLHQIERKRIDDIASEPFVLHP